ncbi:hypothetical protein THIAE_08460 [Thiomicrospira aerophila AL3]|uniref:Uncharacterized protein n=1 Tax=Thiomicrospira aerophila AL3 TaxID=717772 RepID=W0DUT6_9GAMM|nr:hypothetical protein [Thiomicrospira aerophila]AHF02360.1 hypothetical protein THIAE_08460 [Thiomicrospira aerophila AL3]
MPILPLSFVLQHSQHALNQQDYPKAKRGFNRLAKHKTFRHQAW